MVVPHITGGTMGSGMTDLSRLTSNRGEEEEASTLLLCCLCCCCCCGRNKRVSTLEKKARSEKKKVFQGCRKKGCLHTHTHTHAFGQDMPRRRERHTRNIMYIQK